MAERATSAGQSVECISADAFKQAMRRLAAGVTIVTTRHNGVRGGLTATAVCSLSTDPPQLLVCVNRSAAAHELIAEGENLCVNLLAHKHHGLAARFAGQSGVLGAERFRAGRWKTLKTGAPVLEDALASFDCVVTEKVAASTHTIFIGRVVDVHLRTNGKPLLYAQGTFAIAKALAARRKRRNAQARRAKAAEKAAKRA
ncbi:MAG TPA: flavin reductase family protein [Alphaproteobacteria bacterium]